MGLVFVALLSAILACSAAVPPNLRLTGGINSTIEDYPYQILMATEPRGFFCGGTLISPLWAMSSGYCYRLVGYLLGPVFIVSNSSYYDDENSVKTSIKQVTPHPDFNRVTWEYDMCLIEFQSPMECVNCIPIPLSRTGVRLGDAVTISGWGYVRGSDSEVMLPGVLQSGEVIVVEPEQCSNYNVIMETAFCAYREEGEEIVTGCFGDEGAGAVIDGRLVGFFSYSICDHPGAPGMYTDVTKLLPWIEEFTGITPE